MPRRKYRALDLQQLTSPFKLRSTSSYHPPNFLDRRDSFFSEQTTCKHPPSPPKTSTPGGESLELPDSCILRPSSRQALELLRFGSSTPSVNLITTSESLSTEHSYRPRIFLESDFPPLSQGSSRSDSIDNRAQRRCVTLPEPSQHNQLYEDSASISDFDTRSERTATTEPTPYSESYSGSEHSLQINSKPAFTAVESARRLSARFRHKFTRRDSTPNSTESGKYWCRNDMASAFPQMSGDARRHYQSGSTRFENRPPVNRQTPCKNGPLCRKFQEGLYTHSLPLHAPVGSPPTGTCPFNHDFSSTLPPANGLGAYVDPPSILAFRTDVS